MLLNPVMILNIPGDRGYLRALHLCDRLIETGIAHLYEKVGDCHTVTVAEADVKELGPVTRIQILRVLAKIGRDVAWLAQPANHSHEYRHRATTYTASVLACRLAYRQIADGEPPLHVLTVLQTSVRGIELNFLKRLIGAVLGDPEYLTHPSIKAALIEQGDNPK